MIFIANLEIPGNIKAFFPFFNFNQIYRSSINDIKCRTQFFAYIGEHKIKNKELLQRKVQNVWSSCSS